MRLLALILPSLALLVAACPADDPSPRASGESAAAPTSSADGSPPSAVGEPAPDPRVSIADTARIKGADDAPVWIVEISDFQCPYCRDWQQRVFPQLEREYLASGKAKLAYVNLPLPNHRHALLAAEAAMCAGAQGRFWPLHDALFATQPRWSGLPNARPLFDSLALAAGVDMAPWRDCVDGQVMRPLIQRDWDRSVASGANSTPTFLILADSTIGGAQPAMLVGAQPIENFARAIDAMLARRIAPARRE